MSSRPLVRALLGSLCILAAGCGDEICLRMSSGDTQCPDRLELNRDLQCAGSDVLSVDSPGTYGDGYCCYEVTKEDFDNFGFVPPPPDCFTQEPQPGGAE